MNDLAGISETNRKHLTRLHRHAQGLVDVAEAAEILDMGRTRTARLLAQFASQGWTRQIRRGLYLLIPLDVTSPDDWHEDPWILADRLFAPAYIAGWSACEHWEFTEQIFHDVAVFTASSIRERHVTIDDTEFALRKIPKTRFFGTQPVWRRDIPTKISDPTHTIIDVLDAPEWGGGIRHVTQVLRAYVSSKHYDEGLLIDYLKWVGNYAIAKRLGYLLETTHTGSDSLVKKLLPLLSKGYALLDPSVPAKGPYVARWNIRVNVRRIE